MRTRLLQRHFMLVLAAAMLLGAGGKGDVMQPVTYRGYSFVYPVMGPRASSGFGMRVHPIKRFSKFHKGIDLATPVGAPIRAVAAGTVVFADPFSGYGNFVVIQHDGGLTTHYGHCKNLVVKPGTHVKAGQIIATVGSTGMSTGPHLHFEVRVRGTPINPEQFFPGLAERGEG